MCDPERIVAYLEGQLSRAETNGIRQHLTECGRCRFTLDILRPNGVATDDPSRFTANDVLDSLRQLQARLRNEQDVGASLLPCVLSQPAANWRAIVASDDRFRTYGFVSQLLQRFDEIYGSHPHSALEIASFAVDVADMLAARPENLRLRSRVWLKFAGALRNRGEYRESELAYDMAESIVSTNWPSYELDVAMIDVGRAQLFRLMGQSERARTCVNRAKAAVTDFDQPDLLGDVLYAEAALDFDEGSYGTAKQTFLLAAERMKFIGSKRMEGMCFLAIGNCCADTGDTASAVDWWARASALFGSCGQHSDKYHITEEIGRLKIARGDLAAGLEDYRAAERGYEEFAMFGEAIDVSLEIAETLLMQGIQIDEAIARCQTAAARAVRAGMPSQAATAFAYLRRATLDVQNDADYESLAEYVRDVRRFICDLKVDPRAQFQPPAR